MTNFFKFRYFNSYPFFLFRKSATSAPKHLHNYLLVNFRWNSVIKYCVHMEGDNKICGDTSQLKAHVVYVRTFRFYWYCDIFARGMFKFQIRKFWCGFLSSSSRQTPISTSSAMPDSYGEFLYIGIALKSKVSLSKFRLHFCILSYGIACGAFHLYRYGVKCCKLISLQ